MKTLLTILALVSKVTYSQLAFVNVTSVTDTVNVGDSISIHFTTSYNQTGSNMCKIQLWTSTYLNDVLYTHISGLNSIDSIKVKITPEMGTGNARIYSNATVGGYKPFYIKPVVSVYEYDKNSSITDIKYYDILGNEKAPNNESLYIKITTYSNGYQKCEKVMILGN